MPKHSTRNRLEQNWLLGNDAGFLSADEIATALLADIRRATEAQLAAQKEANIIAVSTRAVLQRIDRRLAKRIRLR